LSNFAKQLLADKFFSAKIPASAELKKRFLESDSCSGRTTRLVDLAVQELLETGHCHVQDHSATPKDDIELMRRIKNRMGNEHSQFFLSYKDYTISIVGMF